MLINLLADLEDMAAATEWMTWALCSEVDPEAFFPEKGGSPKRAKQVCAGCPVREECLSYALDNGIDWGVWGGTTREERRQIGRSDLAA
jgi:WhiB family redox-sensing transcriptional regulator